MSDRLLCRIEWVNCSIPTFRMYARGKKIFAIGGCSLNKKTEINKRTALHNIDNVIDSPYGYEKKIFINTMVFRQLFGSDNILKTLPVRDVMTPLKLEGYDYTTVLKQVSKYALNNYGTKECPREYGNIVRCKNCKFLIRYGTHKDQCIHLVLHDLFSNYNIR